MVRALLVLAVLVLAGCPGSKVRPANPNQVWLSEIRIEGNTAIEDDDLLDGLAIERIRRDARAVDPYQLSLDAKRIRGAYLRLGYFDAKVETRVDREDFAEIVVFKVTEGPRTKARVDITGLPPEVPEEVALERLPIREGEPFDYELYDDGRSILARLVDEAGYPHVVEDSVVTVDRAAGTAFVSYRLDAGPRATFGKITITGLDPANALHEAVVGRLAFREGEPYSPKPLAETVRRLYELGRFSQVRVELDRKGLPSEVPVRITVALAGSTELRGGGGFGYDPISYELRLRGGFSYVPEEFPLQTYSLDARIAATVLHDRDAEGNRQYEPRVRILGSLQRADLFRPFVIGDVGVGVDFFTAEAYTATGGLLRLGATFPLGSRRLTVQVGWSLSYLAFSNLNPAFTGDDGLLDRAGLRELNLHENERHGRYEQAIVADLRDNPLDPRRGGYVALRISEGTLLAGGAFDYLELQPDLRGYLPWGRVVFAGRLRGGVFFGDVPMTARFFSGGAQAHRGFSARELAPRYLNLDRADLASVLVGGEAFAEAGVEARVPLGELGGLPLGTTLFVDAGDVTFVRDDLSPNPLDWHIAAGVGVYLKLGAFKVRLDVGKRLNRLPVDVNGVVSDGVLQNINVFLGVGDTY